MAWAEYCGACGTEVAQRRGKVYRACPKCNGEVLGFSQIVEEWRRLRGFGAAPAPVATLTREQGIAAIGKALHRYSAAVEAVLLGTARFTSVADVAAVLAEARRLVSSGECPALANEPALKVEGHVATEDDKHPRGES